MKFGFDLPCLPDRRPARRGPVCCCLVVLALVQVMLDSSAQLLRAAEAAPAGQSAQRTIEFGRDIQPILARRCFSCHGPNTAEAGLRLNSREAALAELDSGEHAVVPGDLEHSALLQRVTAADDDERMPPEGKPLTAEQVELLRAWIAQGAEWRGHWAFEPIKPVPEPVVADRAWVQNGVDAFILSRLEGAKLAPAAPAQKAVLLRRVHYDLTGLPPTPAELDAFLADESADAYGKVVDRLLASPRYGERWARHWLDVVRYAETNSFERDGIKPHAWRYRDYVIRSFNVDKPYDQFLREQLAGDELPQVTPDSIVATGFYRLGLWDDEPADRELARSDELDDILTTTSQAMLGLTLNCARCHDHKIDPLTQRDYYQMVAFFQGIRSMANDGPNVETQIFSTSGARVEQTAEMQELERQHAAVQKQIDELGAALLARYRQNAPSGAPDEIYLADLEDLEYRFYRDTFDKLPDFDALKPESEGKLNDFLFELTPATRETAFGFAFRGTLVVPREGDYQFFLDSDDGSRLSIDGNVVIDHDGIHTLGKRQDVMVHLPAGRLPIRLDYFQHSGPSALHLYWGGFFGHRALAKTGNPLERRPVNLDAFVKSDGARLLGEAEVRRYEGLRKTQSELQRKRQAPEFALSVTENGPQAPDTFVLERGNPHSPAAKVDPGFPGVLTGERPQVVPASADSKTSHRRRALADWIVSPHNPLTARVMVNRVWQHHFGRGIVRSPNNFGGLGTPPTHPELLDYLARQFVDGGWRLKPLHRLILLSSAYRMSAQASPATLQADPGNDLFSRFEMRRISAEELRDSILAVNGRLNERMYGPSFYPEVSAEVMATQSVPGKGWGKSSAEEQARRSLYIHVKRSLITPILSSFDFPDTDSSCEARFVTTPPTQALALFNSKFLYDQSAEFAARLAREAGDDPQARVALAIKLALCRAAQPAEIERGVKLVASLQAKHGLAADAAWKFYCLSVLNQNEFVYLD